MSQNQKLIIVGRSINGITINGLEYLLDDNKEVKTFSSKKKAKIFLKEHGITEYEMEDLIFQESKINIIRKEKE